MPKRNAKIELYFGCAGDREYVAREEIPDHRAYDDERANAGSRALDVFQRPGRSHASGLYVVSGER